MVYLYLSISRHRIRMNWIYDAPRSILSFTLELDHNPLDIMIQNPTRED